MKYVVLGSSAAGINGARELRKRNPEAEIVLISKDENIYSRCILHHYLGGIRSVEELSFVESDFETLYEIDWMKGKECIGLDTENQIVSLEDGSKVSYDKLLIATGAHTFYPNISGLKESDTILGFRNLEDIDQLKQKAEHANHIVIIGGGLVGVDALSGFLHLGKVPVLIEMGDHLLCKQLDKRASSAYEKAFNKLGVEFYFNTALQSVTTDENGAVKELVLNDGKTIPCDLLVVTAGVKPNLSFLEGSEVAVDKMGLIIDACGRTNIDNIYGAGDVTGKSPIWPSAVKEGIIAAKTMSEMKSEMSDFFASKSTMNFEKIPTMSLGFSDPPDSTYVVEIREDEKTYKKLIHKNGRIYGAVLQGDLSYGGILTQLIAHQIDVSKVKKSLFDIDYSDFFHLKDNFEFYYEEEAE